MSRPVAQVIDNVVCTQCGCVCDDLQVQVESGRIAAVGRACEPAAAWFATLEHSQPPVASIEGHPAQIAEATIRAVEILRSANAPLIYGLSRSSTAGQRAAVALADRLGATIDTTASLCHAPSIMAFQQAGESTCSLGETRNRADLVVFWGCDPVVTHPRHMERYSVDPIGEFVPDGRRGRTVVVVDDRSSASSALADLFIQVDSGRDFDALWTLRSLIQGGALPERSGAGAPPEQLSDLARRMQDCRSGVAFFGLGLSQRGLGHHNVEALLLLVRDLNQYTRFYARRMRLFGDVTGADSVLCWQTGYPFSVNLARGYPRFNPGEFSAEGILERREADACLIVGSETIEQMSAAARAHLHDIPTIILDYPNTSFRGTATVRFTTAIYGVHRAGTAYRMDEIPLPLQGFLDCDYPSDDEVLNEIGRHIAEIS